MNVFFYAFICTGSRMMTSNDGHKLDQNLSFSEHLISAFVSEQTLADIQRNLTRFSETNQTACGLKSAASSEQ